MKTVMVTGASGIVGYGILKSLRKYDDSLRLIGTSIYDNTIAESFCDIFEKAPKTTDAGYYPWLREIVKKYRVNLLIPSIELDVYSWNINRGNLAELNCCVLLNSAKLIDACQDKWKFYEVLYEKCPQYAINTSLEYKNDMEFPLLLKPRRGYASQGIVKVENTKELKRHEKEIGATLMVQPIVGDNDHEYTVSAFFGIDSELLAYNVLKRTLSKQGFTETAETCKLAGIDKILMELAAVFNPIGPTNFQFRMDNNLLKLLEINPRISSATSIRTAFGYNESAMCIQYFLDRERIENPQQRSGKAIRYVEDMIYYENSVHF